MEKSKQIQWCIDQHKNTNHFYDSYISYEFHLRMAEQVYKDFKHLLEEHLHHECGLGIWGHDTIEDTRVSYNQVKEVLGEAAANIVYAVSNEKGKTRKERANSAYYKGIRDTPGAVFVKLCDRIANVQYSKMTKSRMFEMYKKENDEFTKELGFTDAHKYLGMFVYLKNLFDEKLE